MNSKRKLIVGVLALLVVMTMGYALFSETVTIGGTAKADGNLSLDLYNPDGTDSLDIKVNGVGSSGTAKIDASRKNLEVAVNFDYPTGYAEIPVKIKNTGDIDLYVDVNIEGTYIKQNEESHNLKNALLGYPELINYQGIKNHDLIKAKTEKNIIIKTKWIVNEDQIEKEVKSIIFNLFINGVQEINDVNTGNPTSLYKYAIGDEISIGTEKFNVIDEDARTVTMLAQNNLTLDGQKQDIDEYDVAFAEGNESRKDYLGNYIGYWSDNNGYLLPAYGGNPSKKDENYGYPVNVYDNNSNVHKNVENYVNNLKSIKGITDKTSLTGRLIHFHEYFDLNLPENTKWFVNNQMWWTDCAIRYNVLYVVLPNGELSTSGFYYENAGVRPVITIDKKYLN